MADQLIKHLHRSYNLFVNRALTVTFLEGQTNLQTSVAILADKLPEDTETFFVKLVNPRLGAEFGANIGVTVNILSNDHGHGIIEFAEVTD